MEIGLIIKGVIAVIAIIIGIAAPLILRKKDSPIEQLAEKVIKNEFGFDVDFTPEK